MNDTAQDTRPGEEGKAHEFMKEALGELQTVGQKSRENSVAITQLETAMMWNNKDRTIKGFLTPTETHVESK